MPRYTIEQCDQLARLGLLGDTGYELIDGRLTLGGKSAPFTRGEYRRMVDAGVLAEMPDDAVEPVEVPRLNHEQYQRLSEIGVLGEGGTELLEGRITVLGTPRPYPFGAADLARMEAAGLFDRPTP